MNNRIPPFALRLTTACLPLLLAACGSIAPKAFSTDEIRDRAAQDVLSMYQDQEPISAPIDFHEAAARALKYNLDYKLKLMETALSRSLWDVSTYEMLPKIVAGAGYSNRSNDSGGTSVLILDKSRVSLDPSTSQERSHETSNLSFSWNALDFGVSYYRAQQKADQVLMAEERRRKVIQNVLQDVRNSYWRAVGAQKLLGRMDTLLERVNKALERAKEIEKQGLMPQAQVLGGDTAIGGHRRGDLTGSG